MSSFSPASPGFKRAQLRAEASAALDSLLPDTNARVIYKAQDSTGRMTTLLSGGAPSVSYEASIGAGKLGKDGVIPPPPMMSRTEIRDVVMADRVGATMGGTDLGERLSSSRPFEPKLLTGREIKERQMGSSVFLKGPDSSPALKTASAQPRPVVAYQLERPTHASSYASSRGQQHNRSSVALNGGGTEEVRHSAPSSTRGSTHLPDAFAAASKESLVAIGQSHGRRQEGLTQQFTIQ